jgi:AsmA protein
VKAIRIILIVVAVVIVLIIIAPFLIPVNQFRPTIEEKASAALGRKVQVGNLSLSLIGGSVGADNLSIGDDPKFSQTPFLTAKSVKVGVEMIPLIFSKTLNVTGITIENPEVTLLRNSAGQWNYSSLGASAASAQKKAEQGQNKPEEKQGNPPSSSNPPAGEKPTSANEFSVQKLDLSNGRIIIGSTGSQKRSTYDHVNVTASDVSLKSKFPVTVSADLPGGGKFKLDGNAGPLDESDTTLTPMDAKLDISGLNLASTGVLDPKLGLGGLLDLNASLASQNGDAETKGTAKLSKALLVAGGSPASQPVNVDFSTKYDLRRGAGVLNPSTLRIGNAVTHLNGTYEMKGDETVLNMKVTGDNLPAQDLQTFLPALGINLPNGASLQGGTLDANLTVSGPTNKLVTNGNVGLSNAKLAGFDLGSKMSSIGALAGIKSGKDLDIQKLSSNLKMSPTGLEADNFVAVVPAVGSMTGQGTVDAKNNLDFKMAATLNTSNVAGTAASPATAGALLGKFTGAGNCKTTAIPFLIKGTTKDPKFEPDVGGIASSMLKSQLGCVGNVAGSEQGKPGQNQNPADAIKGLSGLLKKKPPQ